MESPTRQQIIRKLEHFRMLVNLWRTGIYKTDEIPNVRTAISKNRPFVVHAVRRAGALRVYSVSPPPMVGGYRVDNVNPFEMLFEPPYGIDLISPVLDAIDEAIGVIESEKDFSLEHIEEKKGLKKTSSSKKDMNKVFLVHGHDNELKETVARFLERIDLIPIVLHEQANRGQTIIEKFEKHSNVPYAIVLLTPDDVGNISENDGKMNPRARQNVIFELGYFYGKLGRANVCAILRDNIERPSDSDGILYVGFDPSGGWKMLLTKELKAAGLEFDANKVF